MQLDRTINSIDTFFSDSLEKEFRLKENEIKAMIKQGYEELYLLVEDPDSRTHPLLFKNRFELVLDNFEFVRKNDDGLTLEVPDLNNFDFSDLILIQQILEGTNGTYVEISYDDLIKLNMSVERVSIDDSVTAYNRIYLLEYTNELKVKEREILNKHLIKFPFSDTPPLDHLVFGKAEQYVDSNIDEWIEKVITNSSNIVAQKYKRI